jgi:hypothetical protein
MERARRFWLSCLALTLGVAAAHAQPTFVITPVASDLSADGNSAVGSILDPNTYDQFMLYTRGVGVQNLGPVVHNGVGGSVQMSQISGGAFSVMATFYNGSFGSLYWPTTTTPNPPGIFGYYSGMRACCNGTTCTVVDAPTCLPPSIVIGNTGTCSAGLCPSSPPALGGCCNPSTLVCVYTTLAACTSPSYWWANNLSCGSYPCIHGHSFPFLYSSTTNIWTNTGGLPNNSGGTGLGTASCDATAVTAFGLSPTGRFIVGTTWYGPFATVACNTRGFLFDKNDGSCQLLPMVGTAAGNQNFSDGSRVSTDGNVILGRDSHAITDSSGAVYFTNARCLALFERDPGSGQYNLGRTLRACCNGATCTVIDPMNCAAANVALANTTCSGSPCPPSPNPPTSGACCNAASLNCSITTKAACGTTNGWIGNGACTPHNPCMPATETMLDEHGSAGAGVLTRAGTIVAATISQGKADYILGNSSLGGQLCKYVKNAGTGAWDFVLIGTVPGGSGMTPTGISDDGNTIIGTYGGGNFIWRPSLNGGVPMNFNAYLTSLNGGQTFPSTGSVSIFGTLSADGNALLGRWAPVPHCASGGLTGEGRGGILYLNGSGVNCEPPAIAGGPYDVAQREFVPFGMVGNIWFSGTLPVSAQWQRESPTGSNNWVNLDDSCSNFPSDNSWTYDGTHQFQLRVNMLADPSVRDGRYRVVLTNSCGSATSQPANIAAVTGACCYYDSASGGVACAVELPTYCGSSLYSDGNYLGDNTTCTPNACDSVAGACCIYAGGVQCIVDVSIHCTAATNASSGAGFGGTFAGGGTTCTANICDSVSGACCYSGSGTSDIACSVELSAHCTQTTDVGGLGGTYAGNGTACAAGNTCPAGTPGIGACCFNATPTGDIVCAIQTFSHCTGIYGPSGQPGGSGGLQGKYIGDGVACCSSICRPSSSNAPALCRYGTQLGACCFTDPNNTASGPLCVITYQYNCDNYPNGSNDANAAPFNYGLGGNFYTNTCCVPSTTPPINGCTTSAPCSASLGACINTPYDNSSPVTCTIQVRSSRCTRRYNQGGLFGAWIPSTTTCTPSLITANAGACCSQPSDLLTGAPTGCVMCTIQPQARCTTLNNGGMGGVYAGNGTVCQPTSQCPAQFGPCCTYTSSSNTWVCATVARSACTGASQYGGPGLSCSVMVCQSIGTQPPPAAACCDPTTLACTMVTHTACAGAWLYGATCGASSPCSQPLTGACCESGSCQVTCTVDCQNNAGTYQGDNSTCSPVDPCQPSGACCSGTACTIANASNCSGTYQSDGSVCNPNPCAPTGVCCRGATCNASIAQASCTGDALAGAFFASSAACNAANNTHSPCCYADFNKTGGITVGDIFDFLNDWFAGSKFAVVGGDGNTGTLAVQNIFDFLNAWFAGGC